MPEIGSDLLQQGAPWGTAAAGSLIGNRRARPQTRRSNPVWIAQLQFPWLHKKPTSIVTYSLKCYSVLLRNNMEWYEVKMTKKVSSKSKLERGRQGKGRGGKRKERREEAGRRRSRPASCVPRAELSSSCAWVRKTWLWLKTLVMIQVETADPWTEGSGSWKIKFKNGMLDKHDRIITQLKKNLKNHKSLGICRKIEVTGDHYAKRKKQRMWEHVCVHGAIGAQVSRLVFSYMPFQI